MEKQFPVGIRIDKPREGAPEFVRGRIGVEVEKFIEYLNQHKNDRGWVNFDILTSKEKGTLYLQLNDYKPKASSAYPDEGVDASQIPF